MSEAKLDRTATSLSEFIPIEALATTLGVTKATVYRWRDALALPVIRLGNRTYVHEASVARWLQSREKVTPVED